MTTALAFGLWWAGPAPDVLAQERPAPVAELAIGSLFFADDGVVTEGFGGGALRWHLSPRLSVGPEFAIIRGRNHTHVMLTGNLTFDLLRPAGSAPARVTPFLIVGGGLFQTRESFPNVPDFSSSEGAFTAGAGVRAPIGRRIALGAEARVGWELHVRLNGFLGVRFGR